MFEFDAKFKIPYFPHHLGIHYYVNFLGRLVSNGKINAMRNEKK